VLATGLKKVGYDTKTLEGAILSTQSIEKNGGDDGTRTRGLCRDREPDFPILRTGPNPPSALKASRSRHQNGDDAGVCRVWLLPDGDGKGFIVTDPEKLPTSGLLDSALLDSAPEMAIR
jgi:hypothetical protein